MRNNKQITRNKVNHAVVAVDRQIAKVERQVRKVDPTSRAFETLTAELYQLRQKRARLFRGAYQG